MASDLRRSALFETQTLQEVLLALAEPACVWLKQPQWRGDKGERQGVLASASGLLERPAHHKRPLVSCSDGEKSPGTVLTSGSKFQTDTISKIHISEVFSDFVNNFSDFADKGGFCIFKELDHLWEWSCKEIHKLMVNKLQSGKNNRHIDTAYCRLGFHFSLAQRKLKVVIKKIKKEKKEILQVPLSFRITS